MADAKITALDANTTPLKTDLAVIVDDPGGTPVTEKITLDDLLTVVSGLTELAAGPDPTADDLLIIDNAADAKYINVTNLLKVVDGLTELATAPAASDTLLVVDGGTPKKIQYSNLITGGGQARKSLPIAGCYIPDDSANNAAAQIQHKTSSGGTLHPAWKEALFDDTTDEHIMFNFLMPDNYASAPVVDVYYKCASATANDVCFAAAIAATTPDDAADVDAKAFDTANTNTDTVPGTAGHEAVVSITMTNADSVAANDDVVLVVFRDVSGDGVTGDVEVRLCVLRYTST